MIGQIDDALRLCKQCRLLEFEEEIHAAFTKADSFGIIIFWKKYFLKQCTAVGQKIKKVQTKKLANQINQFHEKKF